MKIESVVYNFKIRNKGRVSVTFVKEDDRVWSYYIQCPEAYENGGFWDQYYVGRVSEKAAKRLFKNEINKIAM